MDRPPKTAPGPAPCLRCHGTGVVHLTDDAARKRTSIARQRAKLDSVDTPPSTTASRESVDKSYP